MKPHGPAPRAGGPARLRRTAQIAGIAIAAAVMLYAWRVSENNREFAAGETRGQPVSLRKFPYPYRAGLTISNDIDWTGSWAKFQLIQDFLSTRESTALGAGLGLDLAGSFLFWENPNLTIHYFMSPEVRDGTIDYIRRGRIDTLHSYGKKNDFSRSDAVRALDEMRRNGMHVDVWIDHTVSSDNLGDDVTAGYGDRPDRPEYHADLTIGLRDQIRVVGKARHDRRAGGPHRDRRLPERLRREPPITFRRQHRQGVFKTPAGPPGERKVRAAWNQ